MVLTIGQGHQLVAQLCRPALCRMQRPLLILTFVVFGAGIEVFLAVAQHGIDEPGQLVGGGGDGLPTNLRCNAVTAGADYPVSRLCTGRARA